MSENPNAGKLRRHAMSWETAFTLIPNAWSRDKRLSFTARGILSWLQSHDPEFEVTLQSIAAQSTQGVSAIRTAVNELEDLGYLRRYRERLAKGRLGGTIWEQRDPFATAPHAHPQLDMSGLYPITREQENPRSEPTCDSPTLAEPTLDEPTLDNRTTIEEHLEETPKPSTGLTYDGMHARDDAEAARFAELERLAVLGAQAEAERTAAAERKAAAARRVATINDPGPGTAPHLPPLSAAPSTPRPEHVSAEQQRLNEAAQQHLCPEGFGAGRTRMHWCPPTDDGCVKCGQSAAVILDAAGREIA